jgi:hypothetical protein
MSWFEVDPSAGYARQLLASHGIDADVPQASHPRSTAADWADSGAMALTGAVAGPPRLVEGAPATTMQGALLALAALARTAGLDPARLPDARALSERAWYLGLRRAGRISAGGATRLLDAADRQVAVTLSRSADFEALPALTGWEARDSDPWTGLAAWVREATAAEVVERAELLGLAAGAVDVSLPAEPPVPAPALESPAPLRGPILVVDLSALWAGPLCGHLLALLGARVVVVESTTRPDPTRTVAPGFHELLRGGAELLTIDFGTAEGVGALTELLHRADVVVESTRPRALHQLGIHAAEVVATAKACSWVSITAYGRADNRVGYGDDVAAAAGLLGAEGVFAGDAIADPLTGAHAAVAALAGTVTGRSSVIDLAMYDVARAARTAMPDGTVVEHDGAWYVDDGRELTAVRAPAGRSTT